MLDVEQTPFWPPARNFLLAHWQDTQSVGTVCCIDSCSDMEVENEQMMVVVEKEELLAGSGEVLEEAEVHVNGVVDHWDDQ